jgi:pentatricopeptide repeat protein
MFDATISLLINGLCEKKRVDEAMNLFREIRDALEKDYTFPKSKWQDMS